MSKYLQIYASYSPSRKDVMNSFKNTFFFQKVEYLYLLSLTALSDYTNRSQVLKFFMLFSLEKKHSISPSFFFLK